MQPGAARIKADVADTHYNLGITFNKQGRREHAFAACGRAIRTIPGYAKAHCNLGVAHTTASDALWAGLPVATTAAANGVTEDGGSTPRHPVSSLRSTDRYRP